MSVVHSHPETAALPCTALHLVDETHLLLGFGPYLQIYKLDLSDDREAGLPLQHDFLTQNRIQIFDQGSIHGVYCQIIDEHKVVFVWGLRNFRVMMIDDNDKVQSISNIMVLSDLIWDINVESASITTSHSNPIELKINILFAFMNNKLELWKICCGPHITKCKRLLLIDSGVRCMSYCTSFYKNSNHQRPSNDVIVAVGTCFFDIHLYTLQLKYEAEEKISSNISNSIKYTRAHDGAVFQIRWSKDGKSLVSTSDDRTVRLWMLVNERELCQVWVAYGHTTRVYDVGFFCNNFSSGIVSCGEDGSIYLWSLSDGLKIASSKSVIGPSATLWCLAVHSTGSFVITGGNRSCRIFNLEYEENSRSDKKSVMKVLPFLDNDGAKLVVCGIQVYKSGARILLVSREGSAVSYDILSQSFITHSENVLGVVGTCISVDPLECYYAVGSKNGAIAIGFLSQDGNKIENTKIVTDGVQGYHGVQNLHWIKEMDLIASHLKGKLVWWRFSRGLRKPPFLYKILDTLSQAIPISIQYCVVKNEEEMREVSCHLFIGDNRGNLSVFDNIQFISDDLLPSENSTEVIKASATKCLHWKQPLTAIFLEAEAVITVGHDGVLRESFYESRNSKIIEGRSLPVPYITNLTNIWKISSGNIYTKMLLSGFYGDEFKVFCLDERREFLSISSGGWKRSLQSFQFETSTHQNSISLVENHTLGYLSKNKNGNFILNIHSSYLWGKTIQPWPGIPRDIGYEACSDVIYSLSLFPSAQSSEKFYSVSGSNDCTSRISIHSLKSNDEATVKRVYNLPPHETCVRAVEAISSLENGNTLIITSGAKLVMNFYIFQEFMFRDEIIYKGALQSSTKTEIDQRINAVSGIPLLKKNGFLIVAGDSDGILHVVKISGSTDQQRKVPELYVVHTNRPILSLKIVKVQNHFIAIAGNTAGEILLYNLGTEKDFESTSLVNIPSPSEPLLILSLHQAGANSITAQAPSECQVDGEGSMLAQLLIASGGDDQSLHMSNIQLLVYEESSITATLHENCRILNASSSAVMAMKMSRLQSADYLFSTGHDQIIHLWKIQKQEEDDKISIYKINQFHANIADIHSLDVLTVNGKYICQVAGVGLQTITIDIVD